MIKQNKKNDLKVSLQNIPVSRGEEHFSFAGGETNSPRMA